MIHLNSSQLHIAGGLMVARIVHSEHHRAEKINLICQKFVVFPIFFYFVLCFLEFNPISKSNVYSSYPYFPRSPHEHEKTFFHIFYFTFHESTPFPITIPAEGIPFTSQEKSNLRWNRSNIITVNSTHRLFCRFHLTIPQHPHTERQI